MFFGPRSWVQIVVTCELLKKVFQEIVHLAEALCGFRQVYFVLSCRCAPVLETPRSWLVRYAACIWLAAFFPMLYSYESCRCSVISCSVLFCPVLWIIFFAWSSSVVSVRFVMLVLCHHLVCYILLFCSVLFNHAISILSCLLPPHPASILFSWRIRSPWIYLSRHSIFCFFLLSCFKSCLFFFALHTTGRPSARVYHVGRLQLGNMFFSAVRFSSLPRRSAHGRFCPSATGVPRYSQYSSPMPRTPNWGHVQ